MRRDPRVVATSDFTLAAVLLVRGFGLLGSEPEAGEPRRRRFVLRGDPAAYADLSQRLLIDDVLVPAQAFAHAQRRLKRLLYEQNRGGTKGTGARE